MGLAPPCEHFINLTFLKPNGYHITYAEAPIKATSIKPVNLWHEQRLVGFPKVKVTGVEEYHDWILSEDIRYYIKHTTEEEVVTNFFAST